MFCVISKFTYDYGDSNFHDIQTNSAWTSNPYGDDYAIVPEEMIEEIKETRGFCDLTLNKSGTKVISFTAREIPVIEEKPTEKPITEAEQLRADIDYLAIMTGVTL